MKTRGCWVAASMLLLVVFGGGVVPGPVFAGAVGIRWAPREQDATAECGPDMRYGTFAVYGTAACLGWPKPANNPQHRLNVRGTATPLLLVNARHDPATGYAWAVSVARQFAGEAVLLTYAGWGHIVYGRSACVDGIVDRYLIERAPPPYGASCPGIVGPEERGR